MHSSNNNSKSNDEKIDSPEKIDDALSLQNHTTPNKKVGLSERELQNLPSHETTNSV